MFIVFVIKKDPLTVYITTSDYFSRFLQELQVNPEDIVWNNVSMESLIELRDKQSNYLCLDSMTQPNDLPG